MAGGIGIVNLTTSVPTISSFPSKSTSHVTEYGGKLKWRWQI